MSTLQSATSPGAAAIKDAQTFLKSQGYYNGPIDGVWNTTTRDQLRRWQAAMGIGESGMLDSSTLSTMAWKRGQGLAAGGEVDQKILQLYGPGMAAMLNGDQEVAGILREAAGAGWDQSRLQGRLQQTNWWKRQGEAQRLWTDLNNTDPGEANTQRQRMQAEVNDQMSALGFDAPAETIQLIAEDALTYGWTPDQLRDTLVSFVPKGTAEPVGSIGVNMARFKDLGRTYHINMTDAEARAYADRVARGQMTEDAVIVALRGQAKAKYPSIAEQIDNGITPEDFFAEHQRTIAQLLERAPGTVDFITDDRFSKILQHVDDKGVRRAMTVPETARYVRTLDEHKVTDQARQSVHEKIGALGQMFGKTG